MKLTSSEQLSYSTVRIECEYKDGSKGTGTGFFFIFLEKEEYHLPIVVTNKHVIENATKGKFIMTRADEKKQPLDTKHFGVLFDNFESLWRKHPDKDVDLCAMAVGPILKQAQSKGINLFYVPLTKSLIPTKSTIDEINALEEILMVGYPNGIWDSTNNKPIFRRGITATHPKLDYCGKKEIMIDAACFPGSSGSPVFIFNEGSYKTRTGRLAADDRIILLGILYAGPQHTATGEIEVIDIPTSQKPITISRIPNNLGLVIKSERILELERLFL